MDFMKTSMILPLAVIELPGYTLQYDSKDRGGGGGGDILGSKI